jgi:MoxR-like ATPase
MISKAFTIYTGRPESGRPSVPRRLPVTNIEALTDPERYQADLGLRDAVNVALHLGQPLLLTGEPGVGKTQLAASVAYELGLHGPLKFETKSTSIAADLFYTYNTLAQFHAAHAGEAPGRGLQFVTYNALGLAILLANPLDKVSDILPPDFHHEGPLRSVVLIDEVDKAPRDFPNDILNEVEHMRFHIPELKNTVIASEESMRPVLIITSNSEKNLPDAFLRRCVYYNIPFPDTARLTEIVTARIPGIAYYHQGFLKEALGLFEICRLPEYGLRKRPATAELLGWLIALRGALAEEPTSLRDRREVVLMTMQSSLLKTREDQELAARLVDQWLLNLHRK